MAAIGKDLEIYLYIGITSLYLKDITGERQIQDGILDKGWHIILWKIQISLRNAGKYLTSGKKM